MGPVVKPPLPGLDRDHAGGEVADDESDTYAIVATLRTDLGWWLDELRFAACSPLTMAARRGRARRHDGVPAIPAR